MEPKVGLWTVVCLFWLQFTNISGKNEPKYFRLDGTLSLSPTAVPGPIRSILWRHGDNFVAEWMKDKLDLKYYPRFLDRTELNIVTGHLQITQATEADQGTFSVEINNVAQADRYEARMIRDVPDPYVWVKPSPNPDLYLLYCDPVQGQEEALKAAEPVSYRWKIGTADWAEFGNKLELNVNDTTLQAETFTCQMMNPVSDRTSRPEPNPFYGRAPSSGPAVGAALGVCLVLVLGGSWLLYAYKKKKCPFNLTGNAPVSPNEDGMEASKLNPEPEKGPGPA